MKKLLTIVRKAGRLERRANGIVWTGRCIGPIVLFIGAAAQASPSAECLNAARAASAQTGVPLPILEAIARTETGRKIGGTVQPWPWAMNVRGRGVWLKDRGELLDEALKLVASGERLFDLGCFQINYHWHSSAFDSIDEMIAPQSNALYAANFLKSLFHETGDWTEAAGFYHSRTQELAQAYKARLAAHLDVGSPAPATPAAKQSTARERTNSFPLLTATDRKPRLGSLVMVANP